MTGASGAPYFLRLLERLQQLEPRPEVSFSLSDAARRVLSDEMGQKAQDLEFPGFEQVPVKDIGARVASGSSLNAGMVIVPCSMSTLCAIAYGITENLIHRAASVQLKEGRRLIVVPRETPLSLIHLRAMVQLKEAGATILPAMPGFYHQPESVMDLVDSVVDRILDQLGLPDAKIQRWKETT
ncbi:MAG: UbiX family flavin prenyltransferase [Acidobacteria bacterium]|nr:UbiX family flavin prenyltransferase [Acidobacteriota bacterium]MCB9399155.1 UbiX family flavin prenyltransferase [Acidobacteriota bacterium]